MATTNVQVLETGVGKIVVRSPYHPDFAPRAKKLGGKWDASQKQWMFDARDEAKVRELLVKIYGTDGSPLPRGQLLTIRAPAQVCDQRGYGSSSSSRTMSFWLAGREVAHASGRDSGARLGDGVVILSGGFSSGGSVKNPSCTYKAGTVFELRDVPRELAELVHSGYHGVTLLDADGIVVAEPTSEPAPTELAELCDLSLGQSAPPAPVDVYALELDVARAEGTLAGLRFKLAEANYGIGVQS